MATYLPWSVVALPGTLKVIVYVPCGPAHDPPDRATSTLRRHPVDHESGQVHHSRPRDLDGGRARSERRIWSVNSAILGVVRDHLIYVLRGRRFRPVHIGLANGIFLGFDVSLRLENLASGLEADESETAQKREMTYLDLHVSPPPQPGESQCRSLALSSRWPATARGIHHNSATFIRAGCAGVPSAGGEYPRRRQSILKFEGQLRNLAHSLCAQHPAQPAPSSKD